MKSITLRTPAKINLTLEILGKRDDGYHNISSIMQAVSLYDILTISVQNIAASANIVEISGNNPLIPYDKTNIAHIAAEKFLNTVGISSKKVSIHIEKHIPVAAGLAGGSSNAAGVLYGLNNIFESPLNMAELAIIASQIGADVNFCLNGGTKHAASKGEILHNLPTIHFDAVILKPENLFISSKEAYKAFSSLNPKPDKFNTELMINNINNDKVDGIAELLNNHLEEAILPIYPEISKYKNLLKDAGCINSIMSGSGPSVFGISTSKINISALKKISKQVFNVKSVSSGIEII